MAKKTQPVDIDDLIDGMTDSERAACAARVLSDTRCDRGTFEEFFKALDATCKEELFSRVEDANRGR